MRHGVSVPPSGAHTTFTCCSPSLPALGHLKDIEIRSPSVPPAICPEKPSALGHFQLFELVSYTPDCLPFLLREGIPHKYETFGLIFLGSIRAVLNDSRPVASNTLTLMYPISGVGTCSNHRASQRTNSSRRGPVSSASRPTVQSSLEKRLGLRFDNPLKRECRRTGLIPSASGGVRFNR